MPETYFVECHCGKAIQVELFQAGTGTTCPACAASVKIPNTNKLKELAGDKYPLLSPIEKLRLTSQSGESPFHGMCHGCQNVRATYTTPCQFTVMKERSVAHHGGVLVSLTGVKLVAASAEERWRTTEFPLLLCDQCQGSFGTDRAAGRTKSTLKSVGLICVLVAFLYCLYANAELVAALSGVFLLIGTIAWIVHFRDTKHADPGIVRWLEKIRWFPEAIASEDEYTLTLGQSAKVNAASE